MKNYFLRRRKNDNKPLGGKASRRGRFIPRGIFEKLFMVSGPVAAGGSGC